ncbi:MAG: GGDEF domain-containing protein [Pseudomonadota bacterium]
MSGIQVFTRNLASHATLREVERLLRHWQALTNANDRLPTYAEFGLNDFDDCLGNIMVLTQTGDDYFYMHYGVNIARSAGFDMTGRLVSSFTKPIGRQFRTCYDDVVQSGQPMLTVHAAAFQISVHSWERLIMPLAGPREGETILVVYNAPRESKHDILDAILQASTNGILAIMPINDDDGEIVDGLIVSANKAAETITGQSVDGLVDHRLLETFPGLLENGVWDRYLSVFATGEADRFEVEYEIDGRVTTFQVGVAAFTGGITVSFTDIGELVRANRTLAEQREKVLCSNRALETQTRQLAAFAEELESSRCVLAGEVRRREELEDELRTMAHTDELTGLPNRRAFFTRAKQELRQAKKLGQVVSAIVFDIDRFKSINDTHGHGVGDEVLRQVSERLEFCVRRAIDVHGRIGGEEFAILMPGTDRHGAYLAAERLRAKFADAKFDASDLSLTVTASFGVATWIGLGESLKGLLHRADSALYSAKRFGRNRVEVEVPLTDEDDQILAVERDPEDVTEEAIRRAV